MKATHKDFGFSLKCIFIRPFVTVLLVENIDRRREFQNWDEGGLSLIAIGALSGPLSSFVLTALKSSISTIVQPRRVSHLVNSIV